MHPFEFCQIQNLNATYTICNYVFYRKFFCHGRLILFRFPGIRAQPLDSSYYHWQASITGPVGSPYEGGIFYLYLKVPFTYPFDPPEVRFLTRIFHPNISRHGDIGIDSIQQHNWVSGLTIPKVLISIQVCANNI